MKLCFVIMPIGSGDAHGVYLNRYTNIIKPAVEGYLKEGLQVFDAVRADFITKTGSITRSVIEHIYNADLVVADLTDLNPNVFYELGVRHALRNGTILVALDGTKLPFDVGDLRLVFYKDRVGAEKEAVPEIQALIRTLMEAGPAADSPVFAAVPTLQAPHTRDLLEAQAKANAALADSAELRLKLSLAEEANLRLRESFTTFERTIGTVLSRLTPPEREVATDAVERAKKSKADEPLKPRQHLAGVETIPSDVFVVMPFRAALVPVYEVIKGAGESVGLRIMRADEMVAPGQITAQISDAVARAGFIIADITGQNPNVLFEIGMATSLGKDILIISQDRERIPFDIADQRVIFYENSVGGAQQLREQLVTVMRSFAEKAKVGPDRYVAKSLSGTVTFDYSNNDGRYVLGAGDMMFETAWSGASNESIHAYSDRPSIRSIALAVGAKEIADIVDASTYDYSSRVRTPRLGEIVVWRNVTGYFVATKVERVQNRGHGKDKDEVMFSYWIQPNKTPFFGAGG